MTLGRDRFPNLGFKYYNIVVAICVGGSCQSGGIILQYELTLTHNTFNNLVKVAKS